MGDANLWRLKGIRAFPIELTAGVRRIRIRIRKGTLRSVVIQSDPGAPRSVIYRPLNPKLLVSDPSRAIREALRGLREPMSVVFRIGAGTHDPRPGESLVEALERILTDSGAPPGNVHGLEVELL